MVCMVNHTTEHRTLDFSKYHSLHCHVKMEIARGKRKDSEDEGNGAEREDTHVIVFQLLHM